MTAAFGTEDAFVAALVGLVCVLAVIAISITVDWMGEMLEQVEKELRDDRTDR